MHPFRGELIRFRDGVQVLGSAELALPLVSATAHRQWSQRPEALVTGSPDTSPHTCAPPQWSQRPEALVTALA